MLTSRALFSLKSKHMMFIHYRWTTVQVTSNNEAFVATCPICSRFYSSPFKLIRAEVDLKHHGEEENSGRTRLSSHLCH